MYSLELLLTVGLASVIIGLVVGYLLTQRTAPSQRSQKNMEGQLRELRQQQEDYQHEVSEHFIETANLINQMTDSYQEVHKHLAKGAQLLAGDDARKSLKALSDTNDSDIEAVEFDENITPPLDYAPKSPDAPGMLNETFGLNKETSEPEIDIPAIVEGAKSAKS